jgi:hypothetical protein
MKRILYFIIISFVLVSCGKNDLDILKSPSQKSPSQENTASKNSICHKDYRALKGNTGNWNFLGFENFGFRGIGRCRGHAIVGQKFSELASFDSSSNCNEIPLNDTCKLDIDMGIKRILNFKTHTFKGFSSLFEFSSNSYVKEQLKSYIRGISHRFSAVQARIRDFDSSNKNKSIFVELLQRIKENKQPYIGVKGSGLGHHAIIGYSVDYIDNKQVICIRDSNIIARNSGESCKNYLYLEDTDIYYHRKNSSLSKLYIFALTSDEDNRVKKYINARYSKCIELQAK